jgi:hypothetical protein
VGERKEGWGGGFGKTAIPFRSGPASVIAGAPGSAVVGVGGKQRGGRRLHIPVLTLGWGCWWRRLRIGEWTVAELSGGDAIGGGGGARKGWRARWRGGGRQGGPRIFVGGLRRFEGEGYLPGDPAATQVR